jgi:hypothetical protein
MAVVTSIPGFSSLEFRSELWFVLVWLAVLPCRLRAFWRVGRESDWQHLGKSQAQSCVSCLDGQGIVVLLFLLLVVWRSNHWVQLRTLVDSVGSVSRSPSPTDRQSRVEGPIDEISTSCATILGDFDGK